MNTKCCFFLIGLLLSSSLFSQYTKEKFDTINCSTIGCENLGHLHSISCGYLTLYLENKTDELERVIWSSVLPCTTERLICKYYKEIGELPAIRQETYYLNSKFDKIDTTKVEGPITYKVFAGWVGDQYIRSKIMIDKPNTESYKNFVIGSGSCSIMRKLSYITSRRENTVPCLSVSIYSKKDPVEMANRIINEYDKAVKNNYEYKKEFTYNLLQKTTEGWTQDKIQGELNSIQWSYSDYRQEGMCEENYFGTSRKNHIFSINEYVVTDIESSAYISPENTTTTENIQKDSVIDKVKEEEEPLEEEEIDNSKPLLSGEVEKLGKVKINASKEYLIIPGFTEVFIQALNKKGENLSVPYPVKLQITNSNNYSFVEIVNNEGITSNDGTYKGVLTLHEPKEKDVELLASAPLEISVEVSIFHPKTKALVYESSVKLTLGIALISGTTIGPGYEPRTENYAPDFYPMRYQIANSVNSEGRFFILVNTSLLESETTEQKEMYNSAGKPGTAEGPDLFLQWPANTSYPLVYRLSNAEADGIDHASKQQMGKNGAFDLLTVGEHENRVRQIVLDFIDKMSLNSTEKTKLFSAVDEIKFRYNVEKVTAPTFITKPEAISFIEIPEPSQTFWNFVGREGSDNAYSLVFHAIGHYVNRVACFSGQRYFNFLNNRCYGSNQLYTRRQNIRNTLADESEYIAYYEANADFFCYLLYQFLQKQNHDFIKHSLYFDPVYCSLFEKDLEVDPFSGIHSVSGLQSRFFIGLYGNECSRAPENVYTDFLMVQKQYAEISGQGEAAQTLHEWIFALKNQGTESITGNFPATKEMIKKVYAPRISIIAASDNETSRIKIDNETVSSFGQIPAIHIASNVSVKSLSGTFLMMLPREGAFDKIWLKPEAKIKIEEMDSLRLMIGHFLGKGTFNVYTPLASIIANEAEFSVNLEVENTTLNVFSGEVQLISSVDDEVIVPGQTVTMNKRGRIRRPKEMDQVQSETLEKEFQ
ncbi:MAG: hypothetical protein K9H26_02240 [Prolixibacteraceae bacterium]|nr:hypothetical protein [Prolixibacteraceae bacterium]